MVLIGLVVRFWKNHGKIQIKLWIKTTAKFLLDFFHLFWLEICTIHNFHTVHLVSRLLYSLTELVIAVLCFINRAHSVNCCFYGQKFFKSKYPTCQNWKVWFIFFLHNPLTVNSFIFVFFLCIPVFFRFFSKFSCVFVFFLLIFFRTLFIFVYFKILILHPIHQVIVQLTVPLIVLLILHQAVQLISPQIVPLTHLQIVQLIHQLIVQQMDQLILFLTLQPTTLHFQQVLPITLH